MQERPGKLLTFIAASVLLFFSGCNWGDDGPSTLLKPANVSIEINDGAEATNDTNLTVTVRGDYIYRMILATNPDFRGASWQYFQRDVTFSVPRVEGEVKIYGRFSANRGDTTDVFADKIEIDLSARITAFEMIAHSDTVRHGDEVSFEVRTGESGRATVAFGKYLAAFLLNEVSPGLFRRTIVVPDGINDDSLYCSANFTDKVGNGAVTVSSPTRLVIRGNPVRPHLVTTVPLEGMEGIDAWYYNGVCFVSDRNHTVHMFDVAEPEHARYFRRIETSGFSTLMTGNSRFLYLADGDVGVAVIGISPPGSAAIIGHSTVPGRVDDVEVNGEYLYIATFLNGVWIVNSASWTNPEVYSHIVTTGYAQRLDRNGEHLYVGGLQGFAIVDIADPRSPSILSDIRVAGDVQDILYYEGKLYLATWTEGVIVYNVEDPFKPKYISTIGSLRQASSLALVEPYLIVSRGGIVSVVNAAVPETLPVEGEIRGLNGALGIHVDEQRLFIAAQGRLYIAHIYNNN